MQQQYTSDGATPEEEEAFRELEAKQAFRPPAERPQYTGFEVRSWVNGIVIAQTFHSIGEIGTLHMDPPIVADSAILHGYQIVPHVTVMPLCMREPVDEAEENA
jgi:hypothetical protein